MTNAAIGDILATELSKISDQIVIFCIITFVVLMVLALTIRSIKRFIRKFIK